MKYARDIRRQLSHMVKGYESEFDSEDEVQVSKMEALRRERGRFHHMSDHEKHHFYLSKLSGLKRVLTLGFANRYSTCIWDKCQRKYFQDCASNGNA